MNRKTLILRQCFPPAVGGLENYMAGLAERLRDGRVDYVLSECGL